MLPFELLSGDSAETAFILGVHGEIVTQLSRVASLAVASLLAQMRSWQLRMGVVTDTVPALQALQRAQALAPGSPDAMIAGAFFHYYGRGDFPRALAEFETVRSALPGSPEVVTAIGLLQRRIGRLDDALASATRATEMDRRSADACLNLAATLNFLGRFSEGLQAHERAVQLEPGNYSAFSDLIATLISGFGDTTTAFARLQRARDDFDAPARGTVRVPWSTPRTPSDGSTGP